jgi:hypothetical protein
MQAYYCCQGNAQKLWEQVGKSMNIRRRQPSSIFLQSKSSTSYLVHSHWDPTLSLSH